MPAAGIAACMLRLLWNAAGEVWLDMPAEGMGEQTMRLWASASFEWGPKCWVVQQDLHSINGTPPQEHMHWHTRTQTSSHQQPMLRCER